MKIRVENLVLMSGRELIETADKLGVKVACNKERTALKESKKAVIEKITKEIENIKKQVAEAEAEAAAKAEKAEKEKAEKKERTPMTAEERKAKRKAYRKERNAKNLENTKELLDSGLYEFKGKKQSLTEWSKELGISRKNLYRRVHYLGWTVERAFATK